MIHKHLATTIYDRRYLFFVFFFFIFLRIHTSFFFSPSSCRSNRVLTQCPSAEPRVKLGAVGRRARGRRLPLQVQGSRRAPHPASEERGPPRQEQRASATSRRINHARGESRESRQGRESRARRCRGVVRAAACQVAASGAPERHESAREWEGRDECVEHRGWQSADGEVGCSLRGLGPNYHRGRHVLSIYRPFKNDYCLFLFLTSD